MQGAFVQPKSLRFERSLTRLGGIFAVGSFDSTVRQQVDNRKYSHSTGWRDVTLIEVFVTVEGKTEHK